MYVNALKKNYYGSTLSEMRERECTVGEKEVIFYLIVDPKLEKEGCAKQCRKKINLTLM